MQQTKSIFLYAPLCSIHKMNIEPNNLRCIKWKIIEFPFVFSQHAQDVHNTHISDVMINNKFSLNFFSALHTIDTANGKMEWENVIEMEKSFCFTELSQPFLPITIHMLLLLFAFMRVGYRVLWIWESILFLTYTTHSSEKLFVNGIFSFLPFGLSKQKSKNGSNR